MTSPANARVALDSPTTRLVPGEIDDAQFGRILAHGTAIGIPFAYLISLLIALPGAGAPMAFMIAAMPAIVAGPWMGTTALLLKRARTLELRPRAVTAPIAITTPRPATLGQPLGSAA